MITLISYTIYAALKSRYINEVYISTDDNNIARISKKYGASVPFLRSKKMAADRIASQVSLKIL